jgi:hypothetical protein
MSLASKGILKLPNEVILRILAHHPPSCGNYAMVRSEAKRLRLMASVCTRFRDIITSYAPFWTIIDNGQHPDDVELYLSRSKQAPLKVEVYLDRSERQTGETFLRKVMEHRDRWKSLVIDYGYRSSELWDVVAKIHALLWVEHCYVNMESLVIRGGSTRSNIEDLRSLRSKCQPDAKWRVPRLKKLEMAHCIPRTDVSFRLTSCELSLGQHWLHAEDPVRDFLAFLASQPLLEALDFDARYLPARTTYPVGVPVEMPNLKRMVVTQDRLCPETLQAITKILQSVRTPRLNHLDYWMHIEQGYEWEGLFSHFNDYAELRSLYVTNNDDIDEDQETPFSPFPLIFRRFHSLEHLEVSSGWVTLLGVVPSDIVSTPPLRTLKICASYAFISESLLNIMHYLMRGQHWEKLEWLEINGCAHLFKESDWLRSIPNSRIVGKYGHHFSVYFDHEEQTSLATDRLTK